MDPDQIDQLANAIASKADELRNTAQQLNQAVMNAPWQGQDRERYVSDWSSQDMTALNRVIDGLHQRADIARRNASEQRNATNS